MAEGETLREWAKTKNVLALKAMAEDMPRVHTAKKPEVVEWLMENDPGVLAESRRIEEGARRLPRQRDR